MAPDLPWSMAVGGSDGWPAPDDSGDDAWLLDSRYRIDRVLRSSTDAVHLAATDIVTGGAAFIKMACDVDLIRNEAEALSHIQHPAVAAYDTHGMVAGYAYLVVAWVDGLDLETYLRRFSGHWDGARLVALLRQLAEGVQAIHRAGYVHRDLKPANVILRPDFRPVIVDFGAACPLTSSDRGVVPVSQAQTGETAAVDVEGLASIGYRILYGRNGAEQEPSLKPSHRSVPDADRRWRQLSRAIVRGLAADESSWPLPIPVLGSAALGR